MTKRLTKLLALALAVVMSVAVLAACQPTEEKKPIWEDDGKNYTYHTYTGVSPSNWNELTYQDNNDTQIMSYIGSSFFQYDFEFDANGEIVPGGFEIKYDAATKLEDVTAKYADAWGLDASKTGFAWKITLRDDLAWEDGTPIKAEDFVYTMSEQLSPLFMNYRADSYYAGSVNLVNAQNYIKQGQYREVLDQGEERIFEIKDLKKGDDGVYTRPAGGAIYVPLTPPIAYLGNTVAAYAGAGYLDAASFAALVDMADDDGNVAVTDESLALWATLICTPAWGMEDESYIPNYLISPDFTFPAMDFSEVGIFVGDNENELVIVLANALPLLKADGTLAYQAAYNLSSLPVVHKATYEACKVAPAEGSSLWTSTYNSSVETTKSWGPYKLSFFQGGKSYELVRNEKWYGYNMTENVGRYLTDKVVCDTVQEWQTAWQMFQSGEIDGIGIDVSVADQYKGSSRAYFTPDDYVGSLQLQSNKEALKERESEGVNKTLLTYPDFRKALSLSIDRAAYTQACTTASFPGFGLFNSMHYYDVENGKAFRESDEAKRVLCDIYAVNPDNYASLDEAVDAITGYNLTEARALLTKAYNEALAAGDIKATDKVVLTFGTSVINEATQRNTDHIGKAWIELAVGTPLEGRLEYELKDFSSTWANSFRAGAYDVCQGGWTGAAWDPGYFLLAYLDPNYMYSQAWDTSSHMMEFTMVGVAEDGGDITETMSLMDWYACLNGYGKYDWSANGLDQELRLQLIARLEKEILAQYYTVPLLNNFSASLISYKIDYITYEYNTFMAYGGQKYLKYNYTDEEWDAVVAENNNVLDYTK